MSQVKKDQKTEDIVAYSRVYNSQIKGTSWLEKHKEVVHKGSEDKVSSLRNRCFKDPQVPVTA